MAKQLELKFNEKSDTLKKLEKEIPTFTEWFTAVNVEHSKHGEKPYRVSEGEKVYKKLVKSDFFTMQSNIWNDKGEL